MRNLRTTIAVVMIVILSIVLGFSMMKNYGESANAIVEAERDQLMTIAEGNAKTIESMLSDIKKSVYILSQDVGFQESYKLLKAEDEAYNNTSIKIFYKIESPRVDKVQILSASGKIVDEYPKNVENIGLDLSGQSEVMRVMTSNSSNFSEIHFEQLNTPYIYLNTPIFIDQKFQGIIRVKVSVKYIYETFLSKIQIHENGYAAILSRNARVIMYPKYDVIGNSILDYATENYSEYNWEGLEGALYDASRGVSGTTVYESLWLSERRPRVSRKLMGYAPVYVDDDYWTIVILSDYEEVVATMRDNYYSTIFISVIVAFGFIILTSYILIIRNRQSKLEDEAKYLKTVEELNRQLQSDLDQRKILQDQVTRSKDKYEAIFDSGSDCMFVLDYDEKAIGRILEVNGRTVNRLGYDRDELMNRPYLDFDKGMSNELKEQVLDALNKSQSALFETYLIRKNGTEVPVEVSARLFELQGEKKIVLISRDISKRMLGEAAVRRSEERFVNIIGMLTKDQDLDEVKSNVLLSGVNNSDMEIALKLENINLELEKMFKKELDESRRKEALMLHQSRYVAMGEMIGNIAHQWRQPLNTLSIIMANIREIVYDDPLEYNVLDNMLNKSKELILNMSQTIDDFRYFFRPQESKVSFDLLESIERTLNLTEERLRFQNVEMVFSGESEEVYGYPNQFSQIVLNLINNSVDALVDNRNEGRKIFVDVWNDADDVHVSISDNGGGIRPELLDSLFEPYVTTKSEKNGTGLGLYMSKMIIEKNFDGSILAYNTAEGACFEMTF